MDEGELIAERRRLKRSRSWWRGAAIVVAAVAIAVAAGGSDLARRYQPYIAELRLSGVIADDPEMIDALEDAMTSRNAKALVLRIDSPGGTVVGGESFFRAVRAIAADKPVVAVLGEVAASGGYMVAIAADHIVAREGTITGSIGVLMQTADVTGLLGKLGVVPETIKSAPLKAVPSPFAALTEEGRAATRLLIDDMYDMFVGMVAERRNFAPRVSTAICRCAKSRFGATSRSWAAWRAVRFRRCSEKPICPNGLGLTGWWPSGTLTCVCGDNIKALGSVGAMTKSELILRLAELNPHLYQRDVERIVTTVFDEITAALARGHRVELRGFGAFSVKRRGARTGRNPRTGTSVDVTEKFIPFFKTGKELREKLNTDGKSG